MPTTPRQSRILGPATLAGGHQTTAYEALVPLTCSHCGQEIAAGALFTRQTTRTTPMGVGLLKKVVVCTRCVPLHLNGQD